MSPRPVPLFCLAIIGATLLSTPQGLAQAPESTSKRVTDLLSAPVDTPAQTPRGAPVTVSQNDRRDSVANTGTSRTDADASTQDTQTQAVQTPAPSDQAAQEAVASERAEPSERQDGSLEPDPFDDPVSVTPASGETADPLTEARRRWRGAVAGETTDLGFRAWVLAALGGIEAVASDTLNPTAGSDPSAGSDPNGPEGVDALDNLAQAPLSAASADSQASRTRDVSGRWLARAGPVALGAAGRVVTTFGAAIPTAFCAPLIVCYIELEPGEVLTDTPSWGDTVRWQVTIKFQGSDPETVVLEIKPSEDAGLTNLVIPTDRRLYTINLVNDPEVHTPILSFRYPDTAERVAAAGIAARRAQEAEEVASATAARQAARDARAARLARTGVQTSTGLRDPGQLDFRFNISGNARFRPVRVYTDGRKTYIDLHPNYRATLPTVVPGKGEENKALNTRVAEGGSRLVIDRVIRDIWLQAGSRKVRISRSAP